MPISHPIIISHARLPTIKDARVSRTAGLPSRAKKVSMILYPRLQTENPKLPLETATLLRQKHLQQRALCFQRFSLRSCGLHAAFGDVRDIMYPACNKTHCRRHRSLTIFLDNKIEKEKARDTFGDLIVLTTQYG